MSIEKFDFEATLLTVNFATRLLAMEMDRDILVDRTVEAFCDIARCAEATLVLYDEHRELRVAAVSLKRLRYIIDEKIKPTKVMQEAASSLKSVVRPICDDYIYPLPAKCCSSNKTCLCIPLVGYKDNVKGFITLYRPQSEQWEISEIFQLSIVSTVAAISFENSELFQQSIEDGLTGLYMRRYLFARLREEIQKNRSRGGTLSVIMLDLDHFKAINDKHGHAIGDAVLQQVGGIIQKCCRQGVDLPCRYGGEEFTILMPGSSKKEAEIVAERIRSLCEQTTINVHECEVRLTLSSGVASIDECEIISADQLLKKADDRLYKAKKTGRNRIVCFDCKE